MSRSYKKNPYITGNRHRSSKIAKRRANKKFRHSIALEENILIRSKYKLYSCSWNICDYRWRITKKEAINWYFNGYNNNYIKNRYPTLNSYINNCWAKHCLRK